MTDAAKATQWQAVWSPWGAAHSITGATSLDARFPGQWFQLESGLHYNWHRHYDASLGRYTQADPLGFVDGPSVYGYAAGDPATYVDPDGQVIPAIMWCLRSPACSGAAAAAAVAAYQYYCTGEVDWLDAIDKGLSVAGGGPKKGFGGGRGPKMGSGAGTGAGAGAGGKGGKGNGGNDGAGKRNPPDWKEVPGSDKQFGKKFGQHRDVDRPGYRTHQEYRDLASQVYNDATASRRITHTGETHIMDGRGNLLRLDSNGNFRSLYYIR